MSLAGNQEYLQIGGLGWGSRTGEGDFTNPFSGQINDIQIFGDVLDAAQISELAGDTGSVNEAPVATDDAVSVDEDGSVTFQPGANDTDNDGDTVVTSAIASSPSNGTAVVNDNGTVTYTPDANFNGADSFDVTISDGKGGFDTSTVTVTVNPVADAPIASDDTASAESDTPVVLNVVGNDSDPDGDAVQVTAVDQSANGTVVINADGTLTYTPNSGFEGLDSFDYVVSDGNGGIDTATVTVNVLPFPTPVFDLAGAHGFDGSADAVINLAHDASFEVAKATVAFSFTADSVGARQGLVSKDATDFSGGGNHLAVYIENGSLIARFQDDLFEVSLTRDGLVAGQEYEVAVTFGANGVELYLDGGLVGADPELNMSWLNNQQYLQIGGLGWASQSGQADFTNPFSGQISDVQIYDTVLNAPQINKLVAEPGPQNGAPVAIDDNIETPADTTVVIDVLGNDNDPDGDVLQIAGVEQSANGTTVVNADGTLSYTPDEGFYGTDSFTYTASDGKGGTTTATVTVDVAEPENPNVGVVVNGGSGRDVLEGGEGDDFINGWGGSDRLYGGAGADTISGGDGNDKAFGGQGNDHLFGGDGKDLMYGEDGDDVLTGSAGSDYLDGGAGNDILIGGAGDDRYVGGSGNDTLIFNADIAEFTFSSGSRGSVIIDHVGGNGSEGTDTVRSGLETIDFNGELLDFDDLLSALDGNGTVLGGDLFI